MRSIQVKAGHTIRVHDLEGEGLPIVFLHGLGCASSFDYPAVAASRHLTPHRRILVDLPGHGFSDKDDGIDYTLESQVAGLVELIEHLQLGRLALFGHSMGGALAISLADTLRDRVAALVVSEANLDAGGGAYSRAIAAYSRTDYAQAGHQEIVRQSRQTGNGSWAATMEACNPCAVHQGALDLVRGTSPSWRALLSSFDFPKTFLFGEKSLPHPDGEVLAQAGIRVDVVAGAGHNMAIENPEGLARAMVVGLPEA